MKFDKLRRIIVDSEDILMEKILKYAKDYNYTKYTSTLKEAWRMSISGLSEALIKVIDQTGTIPDMGPDDDFSKIDIAEFGILEARKHRSRGVSLAMFLSLMKYYYQAYIDLVDESDFSFEDKKVFSKFIKQYFDFVELGFTIEWTGLSEKNILEDLQEANRKMTNEKTKYLTVFESIYDPVILFDENSNVENFNNKAAEVFIGANVPGMKYYSGMNTDEELKWLKEDIIKFLETNSTEIQKEETILTKNGEKTFIVKYKKMLDISQKYRGAVAIFNDITERIEIESKLILQQKQLEIYAFTDPMTGVSNRRTGYIMMEKELEILSMIDKPLSICYIDVDGLKKVNDFYGHTEGDNLINFIVSTIKAIIRDIDIIIRMGGDEFLILFPKCFEADAEMAVERINKRLMEFDKKRIKPFKHSFSYGIVEITKDNRTNIIEIIKVADEKMYQNKMSKKLAPFL